jgi:hypothetical protein
MELMRMENSASVAAKASERLKTQVPARADDAGEQMRRKPELAGQTHR